MSTPVAPAGSPEAKVIGELLVAAGNAGKQYRAQVLQYVGTFTVQIENGIVSVEDDVIAKLPAVVQPIVKTLVGIVNGYVDADLPTFEGDAYDWLCNTAISEGQKLQA